MVVLFRSFLSHISHAIWDFHETPIWFLWPNFNPKTDLFQTTQIKNTFSSFMDRFLLPEPDFYWVCFWKRKFSMSTLWTFTFFALWLKETLIKIMILLNHQNRSYETKFWLVRQLLPLHLSKTILWFFTNFVIVYELVSLSVEFITTQHSILFDFMSPKKFTKKNLPEIFIYFCNDFVMVLTKTKKLMRRHVEK